MLTFEQKQLLKLDAMMRVEMHDHSKTVKRSTTTFHRSTEGVEEGLSPLVQVVYENCDVCGSSNIVNTKDLK